jgi:diguanylate cyclase (GGDEF)-like protein
MASSRKADVFARWGGEEFIAALPDTSLDEARELAEELRLKFEHQEFTHEWRTGKVVPFTVSIGVATRAPGERDVSALLKRADQALYRAKEAGRNRVGVE